MPLVADLKTLRHIALDLSGGEAHDVTVCSPLMELRDRRRIAGWSLRLPSTHEQSHRLNVSV